MGLHKNILKETNNIKPIKRTLVGIAMGTVINNDVRMSPVRLANIRKNDIMAIRDNGCRSNWYAVFLGSV